MTASKVLDLLLEMEAAQKNVYMDDHRFDRAADRVQNATPISLRKLAQ